MQPRMSLKTCVVSLLVLLAPGCQSVETTEAVDPVEYAREIDQWRADREERLTSRDGWMSLAGLYWLDEGPSTFGQAPSNDIVFPTGKAPDFIGTFVKTGSEVRVAIQPGVDVLHDGEPVTGMLLADDLDENTTELNWGTLTWYVIEREEGSLAVRLHDSENPNIGTFTGIEAYPTDPVWRLGARLETYDPPRIVEIPTIYNTVREEAAAGALVFEVGGEEFRLDALPEPSTNELFVIFGDPTNADETYPGGRYIYVDMPGPDGATVVDFNKAYNPPCVFTEFATCPLPPPQNRLALAVTAGEKRYVD